ncbi:MAG: hypothetical protein HFJ28_07015 [Clostridia bacterium]|jgi:hypothetical protein|nr:hypothetical protein [Clostridia bacterium]
MKKVRKRFISIFMAMLFCFSLASIPASATEVVVENTYSVQSESIPLLAKGGYLYSGNKATYTVTVSKSTPCTFYITVNPETNSDFIWVIVENSASHARLVNNNFYSGSSKKDLPLTSGTWIVQLVSSGNCAYGVGIYPK